MELSVFCFFEDGVGRIYAIAESFEEAMIILKKEVLSANNCGWDYSLENIILDSKTPCKRGEAIWG